MREINKDKIRAPWMKYYDNKEFEPSNLSVYNYFEESSLKYSDQYCLDYYGYKIKYNQFFNLIDTCTKGFYKLGIKKGDIVSVCVPNTIEGLVSFFAINRLGGIVNFIHPASSEEEIKDSLNTYNSRVIIIVENNYYKVKNVYNDIDVDKVILVKVNNYMPQKEKIKNIINDIPVVKLSSRDKTFVWWKDFIEESGDLFLKNYVSEVSGEDAAIILHSGGTTGSPKGVVLSNSNLVSYIISAKIGQDYLVSGDVGLALMPMFHGFGLVYGLLFPLCNGMFMVLRPKFEVKGYAKMMLEYKPQTIMGVPTLFESLITEWSDEEADLSFLKCALVGGDTLKQALRLKINKFLAKHKSDVKVMEGYGLSEAVCGVVQGIKEKQKDGTIGIPLFGVYVGIFNGEEEVEYNQEGEICVCSPMVMMGYYNNEEETNNALRKHKDGNVWLHTGDLGQMDEEGFVTYTSRLKRMIVSSGYNVYPMRIEQLLEEHPDVKNCVVIGLPDEVKMEVPKAFIVLKEDHSNNEHLVLELKRICKKNLPKYSWPVEYEIVSSLPTTKVGKINFKELEKMSKKG